jgi:hypothetical protein
MAVLTAVVAALALAAPAGASTFALSGTQTVVDYNAGTFKMHGSLIGDWTTTSYTELAQTPIYQAEGTERFTGCLDRRRDGSCWGDPSGTLLFAFTYSAVFDPGDPPPVVWGACMHPITGGTGSFAHARGVLVMVDTPTPTGVQTAYIGNLTLHGNQARSRPRARAASAPVSGGCVAGG